MARAVQIGLALVWVVTHAAADTLEVPVLWSEPVYADSACQPVETESGPRDVRAGRPGLTLAAALLASLESKPTACSGQSTPVAYRVAFRHLGRTWVKLRDHPPGATIRVRVDVRASPGQVRRAARH